MTDVCTACGLATSCKTPHMKPDTSGLHGDACDVMIIGEAPGHDEDVAGRPFVGASGSLLRMVVEDVGLDEYSLMYTNVVCCRPPGNVTPSAKQVKLCLPRLQEEIKQYSPRLIILLGNTPLKAVLNESGITNWRGSKLERDGITYIPTFHPAYILRNNTELPSLVSDIQTAYDVLSGNGNDSKVLDYHVDLVVSEADAKEMYDYIKAAGVVAFDTESVNAKPYSGARMLMLSFAIDNPVKRAWAVLPDDDRVARYCRKLLRDSRLKIIGHNMKYDQHVVVCEWGVELPGNVIGDSMLASWVLDPTPGRHGLKQLAGRLLGMFQYNAELDTYHTEHPESDPSKGGDQSLVPVDILAPYAAMDAIATLEIHKKLYGQMNDRQKVLYDELIIPLSMALWRMESNGVGLDNYIVNRYIRVYSSIQRRQYELMMSDPVLQKFCRNMQKAMDMEYDRKYVGKTTRVKRPVFTFNPNSDLQMRELLFGKKYFHLEPQGETEKGDPSTKWDFLKGYAMAGNTFLQAYRYYSLMGKMLSTYLKPATSWCGMDGRVRSTYNIHGTVSGRLSSSNPNLQNIPTPEKEPGTVLAVLPVKNIFTATHWGEPHPRIKAEYEELLGPYVDKGGVVLAADYSGMELRTMASVSGCKRMSDIFTHGGDVHRVVSAGIFGVPEDQVTKEMRYRGKWTNWTLLYGGSEYTFLRLYGIPLDEGKRFVKTYYNLFPEILEYQEETKQFARDHGYIESMFGHRRYLPYINDKDGSRRSSAEREAVNHPIQSVASHMLDMALIILDDVLRLNSMRTKTVNTVHDQIMFDVPLDELPTTARLIKKVMEGLTDPDLYKSWFPRMDLSWFTCPLVVELEVGSHYGSLTEYHVKEEE